MDKRTLCGCRPALYTSGEMGRAHLVILRPSPAPTYTHMRIHTSGRPIKRLPDSVVGRAPGATGIPGAVRLSLCLAPRPWVSPSPSLGFGWPVLYNEPPQNLDNQSLFLFLRIGWVVPRLVSSGLTPAPMLSWNGSRAVRSKMASPMCQAVGLVVGQEASVPLQGPLLLQQATPNFFIASRDSDLRG